MLLHVAVLIIPMHGNIVPFNIIVITPWSRCGNVQHCPHGHSYFFNTGTEQTITGGRIQQNCGQGRPTHKR